MKDTYLFLLGKNFELSRAEALTVSDEVLSDPAQSLFLAESLRFVNPRNIPKSPEQLFLDRLGGTIRMAKVLGEFRSKNDMIQKISGIFETENKEGTQYIGISVFGVGKNFQRDFQLETEKVLTQNLRKKVRFENQGFENLTSGQIFDRKLLKKGHEFIIWQRGDSFLLCQTVANQNIRNYTLRDRAKTFRDAHMGMLPPKLAQILLNLSIGKISQKIPEKMVIDPFCGSGTINAEAAISGYQSTGSDKNPAFLSGAKENFAFLAEKFRFEKNCGDFFVRSAEDFPWEKIPGNFVVATEGWLGENFHDRPTDNQISQNQKLILDLWEAFFENLSKKSQEKNVRIALCLPSWNTGKTYVSISEKLFAKIEKLGYAPLALFDGRKTYSYKRDGAHVAREICVIQKNS